MATYVVLANWTDQGIQNFRETVDRADAANEAIGRFGGSFKDLYWTVGPYDIVGIAELPDDESATAFALALGSQGNVRTTTMRAFDADGMRDIIGRVG
jgi:uncharacterized protein with GYD domain